MRKFWACQIGVNNYLVPKKCHSREVCHRSDFKIKIKIKIPKTATTTIPPEERTTDAVPQHRPHRRLGTCEPPLFVPLSWYCCYCGAGVVRILPADIGSQFLPLCVRVLLFVLRPHSFHPRFVVISVQQRILILLIMQRWGQNYYYHQHRYRTTTVAVLLRPAVLLQLLLLLVGKYTPRTNMMP